MPIRTKPFDAAVHLTDTQSQAELLEDAFQSGDAGYIAHALGIVARARGMTQVARDAGVTREALYKALSDEGDPRLSTLMGVTRALGIQLTVTRSTPVTRGKRTRSRSRGGSPAQNPDPSSASIASATKAEATRNLLQFPAPRSSVTKCTTAEPPSPEK